MKVDSVWQKSSDHRAFLFLQEFKMVNFKFTIENARKIPCVF